MARRRVAPAPPAIVLVLSLALVLAVAAVSAGQKAAPNAGEKLSVRYEELTAPDFARAVAASGGTCIVPLGILEKHGPHLPLGTDLIDCREVSLRAAAAEYAVVFPPYFVGQIFEAKHQPGTIAYGSRMMLDFLQQTCDELARNGFKKIVLVNGHGGNDAFLHYFCQAQLESRRDYVVYLFAPEYDEATEARLAKLRKTSLDGHAGEEETSVMLAHRPELVRQDRARDESGADQKRQAGLKNAYTGIWWYAGQPNHYRGDGAAGNAEFGRALLEAEAGALVETLRSVKADEATAALQKKFFDDAAKPLETKPFVKK
ncbi:MAG: creatininase family protein [Candidatus Aminicenantes bacterium]|nr:creatininase family protein [Candidatus Aminicenantes bacterium]NLH77776.1 creatininase family protein [Acidobacteriota bacterium]